MQNEELWTIDQTAKYLNVDQTTIRRWCKAGTLSSCKVGGVVRVHVESVMRRVYPGLSNYQNASF